MYVTKVNYQLEDGHATTTEFTNQYGHPMEGFVEFDQFYIRFSAPSTDEEIEGVSVQINEVTFVQ
jgi:hypothetical protein